MGVATRCVITIMTSIKMNKYKMIWGVLMASLLGLILGGCSKELGRGGNGEVPGLPEKGQAVTFTVTTGVETYAVPAQAYEKSISTLQAILFDANGLYVTSGTPAPTAPGSASYTLPIATTGSYKMLLVANHTIPAGNLTGKTLSGVRAILVDSEPGMPNAFVMASTTTTDFTVTTGATAPAGTINLERLAARIDVQSTLDKLTLSKITVKNRKIQSSLLAASSTDAYRTDVKEYVTFERFRKPATDASMGQIYAYENSAASAASLNGTSLVIETAYAGVAVNPLEVKLPQLKRNYIYSVQLMMGDEGYVPDPSDNPDPSKIKLTYNVRVVDWNNGRTFTVSEEDLLKIFKAGAVSYSYALAVTTTPDISKGVSADGGTVTINATATKQKLVGGTPDPTAPAETISGGDKFTYKVLGNSAPWLTVSPAGVISVAPNTDGTSRAATIEIALKEDPSHTTYLTVMQLGKPATPTISHVYALSNVTPASLTFEYAGGSQKLSVVGTDTEMQNGTPSKTTPLTIADVTVTKTPGADWLTLAADGTVTAAKNTTTEARAAVLTISVSADPKQTKSVSVLQQAGQATTEYSITSVSPSSLSFDASGGDRTITAEGKVVKKLNGAVVSTNDLTSSDFTIESNAGWLTVSGNTVHASSNSSFSSRSAIITVRVKDNPSTLKSISVSQAARANPKYNPLAYVAKYNVTSDGLWDVNHTIPLSKDDRDVLMYWGEAARMYRSADLIQGSQETYKLPSQLAWQGIFCAGGGLFGPEYDKTEEVEVAGQKFNATGDYKRTPMTVNGSSVTCTVALRFNGNGTIEKQYRSAWLYYLGTNVVNGKSVNGLWVYCVNISGRQGIVTVNNLDQAFWDQNLSSAVVRFFPAAGNSRGEQGQEGFYWSVTELSRDDAYYMSFNDAGVYPFTSYDKGECFSVRLFALSPLD